MDRGGELLRREYNKSELLVLLGIRTHRNFTPNVFGPSNGNRINAKPYAYSHPILSYRLSGLRYLIFL